MNVFMISERFPHTNCLLFPNTGSGGGEISEFILCHLLSEKGINVTVITHKFPWDRAIEEVNSNLRIIRVPLLSQKFVGKYFNPLANDFRYRMWFFDCERILKVVKHYNLKPSLLHVEHKAIGAARLKEKLGVPVVATIRDYWPMCASETFFDGNGICLNCTPRKMLKCMTHNLSNSFAKRACGSVSMQLRVFLEQNLLSYKQKMLSHADRVLVNSQFMKKMLRIRLNFSDKKVSVIYPFLPSFPYVNHIDRDSNEKVFSFIGWLTFDKGVVNLLQAFGKAVKKNSEIHLRIFGSGSLEEYIVKYVYLSGLKHFVTYEGLLKHEDFPRLVREIDVVIVPSLRPEPFGRVALETMLCGRPVIVNPVGGLTEQVEEGFNGFYANCYDVDAFADKILEVANIPREKLMAIGERAREYALKKFDNETAINKLVKVYENLL